MDRRHFFVNGMNKVASVATHGINEKLKQKAKNWIRPPFAIDELDFLLACTRCDKCIDACPHDVIFPLSIKNGVEAVQTPALDLLNKGCQLCSDWPCVDACEPHALSRPDTQAQDNNSEQLELSVSEAGTVKSDPVKSDPVKSDTAETDVPTDPEFPLLAKVVLSSELCLPYLGPECGACKGSCPVEGALIWEGDKPRIDAELCVGCASCREACIVDPKAISVSAL